MMSIILFRDAYVRHDSKIMTIVHKFQTISRKISKAQSWLLPDFKRKNADQRAGVRNVNKRQRCQRTHFSRNNCCFWHFFLLMGDKWSKERGKDWIKKKKSKSAEKQEISKRKVQKKYLFLHFSFDFLLSSEWKSTIKKQL